MMTLRTEVALPKVTRQLSYHRNALMVGSCFTENIGNHLRDLLFPVSVNPCGILYNPASVAGCIDLLLENIKIDGTELFLSDGLWKSFLFHGRYSDPDKAAALHKMNSSIQTNAAVLGSSSHLLVTFGTSWVYRVRESGEIAGNCHKLPSRDFIRERLSVEEMTGLWTGLLNRLFGRFPELTVVMTVSPVRHLKDGSFENQVGKSGLFLLIDNLINRFGPDKVAYFPSYELVMDELRDYRFYDRDMVHLSEVATDYVQEKFSSVYLEENSIEISKKIEKINIGLNHRPFQPAGDSWQKFLSKILDDTKNLALAYPYINFESLLNEIIQKMGV